jgi:hypothetical protein
VIKFLRQKEKRKSGKIQFMAIAGKEQPSVQFAEQNVKNIDRPALQRKNQAQKIILSQNVLVEDDY